MAFAKKVAMFPPVFLKQVVFVSQDFQRRNTLKTAPDHTPSVACHPPQDRWRYSPELGNVAFGSAVHGWAFRLERMG